MEKNSLRILVVILALCALTMQRSSAQQSPPIGLPNGAQLKSKPIPKRMMYFFFLRRVNQYATSPSTADPADPVGVATYFQKQIGLSAADTATLSQSAAKCVSSVAAQDLKAQELIDNVHAQNPGGRLAVGQSAPPVPPELVVMQANRDSLMDSCISGLQASLPVKTFAAIDLYVTELFGAQTAMLRVPDVNAAQPGVR